MNLVENQHIELKREVVDDLAKEIIAFANVDGGKIYIGVDDDGTIIGIDDPDAVSQKISNIVTESIDKDLKGYISIENEIIEGKNIIVIHIARGADRPYYLKSKGLMPSGVYVRVGTTKKPASDELIKRMIYESMDTSYERTVSENQELTFEYLQKKFKDKKKEFKMNALNFRNKDGMYNFAAFLFSDQNTYDIKCATYEKLSKVIFRDRELCEGSLVECLDKALLYAKYHNMTRGVITSSPARIDQKDYPGDSIREALINGIIHKDYYMNGSTRMEFFDDRVEIMSMGALQKGLSVDDMLDGTTAYKNPIIVRVFHILEYIEHYGTGILRIKEAYENYDNKPEFKVGDSYVRVTLYNTNYYEPVAREEVRTMTNAIIFPAGLTEQEKVVYEYLLKNNSITRKNVEIIVNVKYSRAGEIINGLLNKNIIIKEGNTKKSFYKLK
ncbi:MAG: hypothetical protein A2Y24_04905 [Clostridiales bacterium GWE2_32_10]|nr:MAG: hypothetical protein A2Y24_04905 [Clostridiales bacterium GWE2_32_10]HBY20285.1 hypothetical protein [Clostridiales bacterium]